MKPFVVSTLVVLAWVSCVSVRPPALPSDADQAAAESLETLRERSRVPVALEARHAIPTSIRLQVPVGDGDPIEEAYAFLEEFAPLYGLDAPREQLHPRSARTDAYGIHVRFVQRSGDLPLFNSGLTVHVGQGVIYLTSGRWVPGLVAAPPRIDAAQALAGLRTDPPLRRAQQQGEARLGLYARWSERGRSEVRTVWRMTITGELLETGAPVFWRLDVDATTGELVHRSDLVMECDKDFDIMFTDHEDSDSCWAFVDTQDWFDADGKLDEYDSALDHNDDGIEAFDLAHKVYDWFRDTYGECSYDDDDAEVEIITHANWGSGTAKSNGFCGDMRFQDNTTVLDLAAHEYTHLVDYNHVDLDYQGQSGALDESFADLFASFVDGNWTIGEGIGAFRSLAAPGDFGDPDHMLASKSTDGLGLRDTSLPVDNGFVHVNSGIPNKAAFLVVEGGEHNGFVVSGIGKEKAKALYHTVHIDGLECDSDFQDARDALVGTAEFWAALNLLDFESENACTVRNAFASVGVDSGGADSDCDGVEESDDGDNDDDGTPDGDDDCPHLSNPSQADTDGDGEGDACDDDLDGDDVANEDDNCPGVANQSQADADGDGVGNKCDDEDGDGVLDGDDNCPDDANWDQADADGDGDGDVCDEDADGDGLTGKADNCPLDTNVDQLDQDGDGFGDACDNCVTIPNPDQDACACPAGPMEYVQCSGWLDASVAEHVDPLDVVSLPWLETTVAGEDVELTVVGTSEPWVVTDHFGNVVARSTEVGFNTVAPTRTATWTPALDYSYGGTSRAPFATTYALVLPPTLGAGTSVELRLAVAPE